jgi:hypothetical protein
MADGLIAVWEKDVRPTDPDLVIIHEYGDHASYEAIISGIRTIVNGRSNLVEVLLVGDHLQQNEPFGEAWHEDHNARWLPELAACLGCGYVDIRGQMKRLVGVLQGGRRDAYLAGDGVHLSAAGIDEETSMILDYFPSSAFRNVRERFRPVYKSVERRIKR